MASADYQSQGTYLNTVDSEGNAPASRVTDAMQAQSVYNRARTGYDLLRGLLNAKVQGAINGNPPVSQAFLDAEGLGWQSNLNWRQLEADVNSSQVPFYMLFADVPQYAQITGDMPGLQPAENLRNSAIVGEEHTKLLRKWENFDYHMQLGIRNMTTYGVGPLYFENKEDWRFRAAKQGCIYVPDETTQEMDQLPILFIYYEWDVTELYRMVTAKKASEVGWNPEAVKKIIVDQCNAQSGWISSNKAQKWEYWQQKIREHDVYWSQMAPKVQTVWGFVREFDGKITRFLISSMWNTVSAEFLFKKDKEFDSWSQIIHPMFAEIGNGNWNGSLGVGIKAFNFRDAQNRLKNRILDAAFIGSQVLLQAQDDKAAAELQLLQLGPMAILPPGVAVQQMPMAGTLDKPMMVDRSLEVDLQRNIGGIRQNLTDAGSSQPVSAKEAEINASYTTQLTQAAQAHWLAQLDRLYAEQMRRICIRPRSDSKAAPLTEWEQQLVEFHKNCTRRGVPPTFFKHIVHVCATRSIGRGSEYAKNEIGMRIYQILRGDPNVPPAAVIEHLRNLIGNMAGREYLNMIWPDSAVDNLPTNDASKAQDENGIMMLGLPPIITPEQNNLAHLMTHLPFLQSMMQAALQQQFDPASYLKTAGVGLPHVQQHLEAMRSQGGDGKQFQQLFNLSEQLQAGTKQVMQQYQAAQEAAQAEQQKQQQQMAEAERTGQLMDPESRIKMARVQADSQINAMEAQARIAREDQIAAANINRNAVVTAQDMGIKDVTTATTIQNDKKKTDAKTRKPAAATG